MKVIFHKFFNFLENSPKKSDRQEENLPQKGEKVCHQVPQPESPAAHQQKIAHRPAQYRPQDEKADPASPHCHRVHEDGRRDSQPEKKV